MSTLTRSTGVLLSIFIAFFMGNAFLVRIDRFSKAVKTVLVVLVCVIIMLSPLLVVVYWRPYILHCKLRLEREWQGPYPEWCFDKLPSVYTYIQLKYWDNRFLGFLYRKLDNFLVSIPMNLLYMYMTFKMARSHPKAFFTLGILTDNFNKTEDKK